MKRKALTTVMVVLTGLLTFTLLPQKAQAGHGSYQRRTVSTCGHCHRPVYAYRVISYYDSCRRPVYRWATQSHSRCGSRYRSHYSSRGSSHHGRSYYSGSYSSGRSNCRPSSGFSFSFGRHR